MFLDLCPDFLPNMGWESPHVAHPGAIEKPAANQCADHAVINRPFGGSCPLTKIDLKDGLLWDREGLEVFMYRPPRTSPPRWVR